MPLGNTIYHEIRNTARGLKQDFADMFSFTSKIHDVNKKRNELSFTIFSVTSSNIEGVHLNAINHAMISYYAAVISNVILQILSDDATSDYAAAIKAQLSNSGYSFDSGANAVIDRFQLAEGGPKPTAEELHKFILENIIFNEDKFDSRIGKGAVDDMSALKGEAHVSAVNKHNKTHPDDPIQTMSFCSILDSLSPSEASQVKSLLAVKGFYIDLRSIQIDAGKIIEVLGETKNRDILFQYLKLRAGTSSLFKDFILNLKTIDKDVQRAVSDDISDRIMNDLTSRSGTLTPKLFAEVNESKYYTLILERSDVESLKTNHNFDLYRPANLKLVFEKYKILSLVVVDNLKRALVVYSSSNPLLGAYQSFENEEKQDAMQAAFAKLLRK